MSTTVTTADPNQPGPHDPAVKEYLANGGKAGDQIAVSGNIFSGYTATKVDKK